MNKNLTRDLQILLKLLTYIKRCKLHFNNMVAKPLQNLSQMKHAWICVPFTFFKSAAYADNYQKSPTKLLILSVQET